MYVAFICCVTYKWNFYIQEGILSIKTAHYYDSVQFFKVFFWCMRGEDGDFFLSSEVIEIHRDSSGFIGNYQDSSELIGSHRDSSRFIGAAGRVSVSP